MGEHGPRRNPSGMARHAHATKELKREVEAHLRRGEGGCTARRMYGGAVETGVAAWGSSAAMRRGCASSPNRDPEFTVDP